jgi:uncharacterized protein (DUF488 family)
MRRESASHQQRRSAARPSARAKRTVLTMPPIILTVGHSMRPIEEFVHLLDAHGVQRLVDVRTVPRSGHNPQFNKDSLPQELGRAGIAYTHMPSLGGLRHPRKNSLNLGWRNTGFRGFADYMQTPEFKGALSNLITMAEKERVAIMCAEALPWRCHRSLIADALLARGVRVEDIFSLTSSQPHRLTPFAQVFGTEVTYPGLPFTEQESTEKSS